MQTGNYWDRLALIIAALVEQRHVANEEEFYQLLNLDPELEAAIRNREEELPNPSVLYLKEQFNVGSEYLKVGLGPMIYITHHHDVLLDEEINGEEEEDVRPAYKEEEITELLTETIELSEQDLRNKGHITDEDE